MLTLDDRMEWGDLESINLDNIIIIRMTPRHYHNYEALHDKTILTPKSSKISPHPQI